MDLVLVGFDLKDQQGQERLQHVHREDVVALATMVG